ncbi:hypothetical protein BCR35DRAFT_9042 [Leucosporidium creatinivorum]|uniref:BAG domain-containing protein n=1 Tax=Leucosporidium creatinivorum TaxID=106004 RepID=A0A1Y2G4E3_9BASI|nr:hypothetical protein BCR35DRAFT_9042 [Leucosporidium creatinivorum]
MFHFAPRHQSSPFDSYTYSAPSSSPYDAYDARRSHLEQVALAMRQQERREAEEALLRRRQQQLAIEKEVERRRIAAYQAALEQQIYEELEEERQWRAQQQAVLREQQRRQALEEEHRRKILAARQQEEFFRRRQEQARRQQIAEREQQQEQDTDSLEAHLQPFLQLLFGSHPPSQPSPPAPVSQPEPQAESTPAATIAEPAPTPRHVPSTAPQPAEQERTVDPATTSAAEKLQRHYRTHLHRRQALSTLASLASSLDAQQSAFTLPSTLTFQPSPPSSTTGDHSYTASTTPSPKLAFQSSNAPFLAYEDFLVSLLSKIDAVSSGGDRTVKQARKQLVKRVDAELSRLDDAREQAWAKERGNADGEQEPAAPSPAQEQDVQDSADSDELPSVLDSALPSPSAIEPSSSPLPVADSTFTTTTTTSDASTPLTSTTLASTPSVAELSTPRPESAASSDADSDDTLSVDESDVEAAINDVVRQAHKLGEDVIMLEKVELGRVEEAEKATGDFV